MKTLVIAEHNGENLSAATLSVIDAAKKLGRDIDLLVASNSSSNVLDEAIQTEIKSKIPLKSFGDPIDIAQTALFLASENADYISGQTISIDGGLFID